MRGALQMPAVLPRFARRACPALLLPACLLLSACVLPGQGAGDGPAAMQRFSPTDPALPRAGAQQTLIDELRARKSILPPGGRYATIADAVLRATSGAAQAELQMAQLQAEARAKNWLPTLGPRVSLTSLGTVVAQILLEQAILDHGRRKAERAHAAADVEVAAVKLSAAMNARVHDGLQAYVLAERARAQAAVAERAVQRLQGFEDIVNMRVQGGLSDRSEQNIIAQSRAEMQASLASDRQAVDQALQDLAQLAGRPLPGLGGLDPLPADVGQPEPLSVLMARAEGARSLAEAQMAQAGLLPGLTASVGLDQDGTASPGLTLGGAGLGLGTGAQLRAAKAAPDLVERRSAEARDLAQRQVTATTAEIAALQLRQAQGAEVLRQTQSNLALFAEQYRLGGRSLLDLVSQYQAAARLERDQTAIGYDIALLQLRLARDRGSLVDGGQL